MTDDVLQMLRDSAAAFARGDPNRARRLRGTVPGFERRAWKQMADQGWLNAHLPTDRGGLGLGIVAAAVIARELGRAALPEPFTSVGILASTCLTRADDEMAWNETLSGIASGDLLATVVWQSPLGSIDVDASEVFAAEVDQGFELNGIARFVPVPSADGFIVLAKSGSAMALYWVPRDESGLKIELEPCPDGSSVAILRFERVRIAGISQIVGPHHGIEVVQCALDAALIASSAELLGVMDGALEMTLQHLRTRKQFGVAIGSFQALQHRAVDIWIQREITEAAVFAAARIIDDPRSPRNARSAAASGAKARAAQSALSLCNQALQLHGAIGFADEYGLGLLINRALTISAWLGNAAQHRRRYSDFTVLNSRDTANSGT
jgi:alkylation response protein AidB-like acyl-CoA dehydrogenase